MDVPGSDDNENNNENNVSGGEMDIQDEPRTRSPSGDSERGNSHSESGSESSSSSGSSSAKSKSSSRKSRSSSRMSVHSRKSNSEAGSRSNSRSSSGSSNSDSESNKDEGDAKSDRPESADSIEIKSDSDEGSLPPSYPEPKSSTRKKSLDDIKQLWEENPEEFGIRRSGRSRKEPARYNIGEDSDGSDTKKTTKKNRRRKNSREWNDSDSDSDSDSSFGQKPKKSAPPLRSKSSTHKSRPSRPSQTKKSKPAKKKQHRNLSSESDDDYDSDSDDQSKAIVRQTRKTVKSYKEQSADETDTDDLIEMEYTEAAIEMESAECIEKVLETRMGKKGATGGSTTVYTVDDFGDPNDDNASDKEEQFLIKWKGWSYLHNTWESEATLKEQKVTGMKKLENFKKITEEVNKWKSCVTKEDIEFYECKQELEYELRQNHMNLERIIAHQPSKSGTGTETEYFCKWAGLPYGECTWEEGSVITKKFQQKIDEYFVRTKSQKIPSKICKALKFRPKFIPLKSQPKYVGNDTLQLRDYQLEGLNWLIHTWSKENSVILADEMGLGKTIQTISFLSYLFNQHALYGPFLLVVPLSTMTSWQREFEQWAPEINVVTYVGDISSRAMIRQYEWVHPGNKRLKFNVLLTTYDFLLKDKGYLGPISWAVLGVDEAHRLKNDDSLLYKSLFDFDTNHRLLITGTPLQNSLRELWALIHFIMPAKFPSLGEFESEHEEKENVKGYPKLHKQLEPYIIRRVKKDVEKSLPAKVERILRVEMTSVQKQFYKWILARNYAALTKGVRGNTVTFNNIIMELKKCCNHAMLVRPVDNPTNLDQLSLLIKCSGKIVLLDKLLCRLRDTGHRVLIFSQMVMMLDILAEYLQARHFPFQRLDGSIRGDIRKQALDHFNAEGSQDFCFLLSTRAGGLGINLATADTVIIFDSDWNPQNDLQAQARAHRIGQKNQVNIYRLVTKNSIEEEIIERAKKKMVLDHLVIQRMDTTGRITTLNKTAPSGGNNPFNKEELAAIIQFGAHELFKETGEEDEEPQVDIDEILSRAETREDQAVSAGEELLSSFKVASFNFNEEEVSMQSAGDNESSLKDWSEIIPETERKKYEDEIREKEEMDLYLPPRSRKSAKAKHSDSDSRESASGSEDADSDEDKPRKRGRPRLTGRDGIKGFTDVEIRRFIKSYKKFPAAMKRLESIAMDGELQEKPMSDLKRLGELLHNGCETAMTEHKAKESTKEPEASTPPVKKRGRERGPSFKLSGVIVNAKTIISCETELEPLDIILPSDSDQRKNWTLKERVRDPHFDVPWEVEDDSNLLKGVYEHGMGNWESIKMDPQLKLTDKILSDGDQKPQAKNLQSRCDYLLKIMKRLVLEKSGDDEPKKKSKRGRKPKTEKAALSKAFIENDDSDASEKGQQVNKETKSQIKKGKSETTIGDGKHNSKEKSENATKLAISASGDGENAIKKEKKPKKKDDKKGAEVVKSKPKKTQPVMHYTANAEPQVIDTTEMELKEDIFLQCKEQMRPIKKYLMRLDLKAEDLTEEDKTKRFSQYLIKIGRRINELIKEHTDPEKVKEWRNYLWIFVSNFTEQNANQLFKIYRQSVKHQDHHVADNHHHVGDSKVKKEKFDSSKRHDEHHQKNPSPQKPLNKSKPIRNQNLKRPLEDDSNKSERSGKKKFFENQRKDDKGHSRKDSFSELVESGGKSSYGQKNTSNSYSNPHHGYSGGRDNQQNKGQGQSDRWSHNNQSSGWSKDRYNNDYNKRDHYRGYNRDDRDRGGSYARGGGKGHRQHGDYGYSDRHNNRYQMPAHHGSSYPHYGMRPSYSGQPLPAHGSYGYNSPLTSPPASSQPPPPGFNEHSPVEGGYGGSYQGHGDSWRRRPMDGHKGESSSGNDYKAKR